MSDGLVLFPNTKTSTTIWDITDDRSVGVLEGHINMVVVGALNAAGSVAMTMGRDNATLPYAVKIWSMDTLQCTANMTSTSNTSSLLKDRLLLGSSDGPIKVWDIGGSAPVALMDLQGSKEIFYSIAASDASNIAMAGSRDTMLLWDLRTGQIVRDMSDQYLGHIISVSMDSVCQTAASASFEGTALLWDLGSGQRINNYDVGFDLRHIMMHESGSLFLTSYSDASFKAWSTVSGHEKPIFQSDVDPSCGYGIFNPSIAASRDLSRVGMCYMNADESELKVSVWK